MVHLLGDNQQSFICH